MPMEQMSRLRQRWRLLAYVVAVAALLLAPAVLSTYPLSVLTEILIFGLFAMSLNLLLGYTGLPTLGHSAFFGAGGYVVGLLAKYYQVPLGPALLLAILAGVVLALVTGPIVLRTSGAYFLMLTLSLTQVLFGVVWLARGVTGGDDGLPGIPTPQLAFLAGSLEPTANFYYLALAIVVVAIASMAWVVRSSFGLALLAIRENERVVEGLGYPTWLVKYAVYALAGGYGALAGALYTFFKGYVGPGQLSWLVAGEGLVMTIVGGAGTFWGPMVGAAVVLLLRYEVSTFTQRWLLILGLIFIATVVLMPRGIVRLPERLREVRARVRREELLEPVAEERQPAEQVVERS